MSLFGLKEKKEIERLERENAELRRKINKLETSVQELRYKIETEETNIEPAKVQETTNKQNIQQPYTKMNDQTITAKQWKYIRSIERTLYRYYNCSNKYNFKGTTKHEASVYIDSHKDLYNKITEEEEILYKHI